jgi:NTP pyrophosphatase (non-canonical NTP hydrolase)
MNDAETTLAQIRQQIADFVAARAWEIYHTPKNLSLAVSIEAAELMEHFLWLEDEQAAAEMEQPGSRAAVADELADVLIYSLSLANALGIDVSTTVRNKLDRNEARFPAGRWRGRARGVDDESPDTAS